MESYVEPQKHVASVHVDRFENVPRSRAVVYRGCPAHRAPDVHMSSTKMISTYVSGAYGRDAAILNDGKEPEVSDIAGVSELTTS